MDALVSIFENSTTEIQYNFAENLDDGRGVTSGRAGFCTATGDTLEVVQRYTGVAPRNPLARFLPELRRLAATGSDETMGLPEAEFIQAWQQATFDPRFRTAQDQVNNQEYFDPAMRLANASGIRTPLGRAAIYDATIQHGNGTDPDSVAALIAETHHRVGGTPAGGVPEQRWIATFFQVRLTHLRNPADETTQLEWSESVDRVYAMARIAATGNYNLRGPLFVTVFGDRFQIP